MKKTVSIILKTFLVVATASSAFYALAVTPPKTPTGAPSISPLLNESAANQIKEGGLGIAVTDKASYAAATTLGYKLYTDGGAVLGPTAVFGNFTATGPSITFSGLPNKQLCTDGSGTIISCAQVVGNTCGLKASEGTTKGCPAGSYLVQMSADGVTGTCRWFDTSHAGGTAVPNTTNMCY